MSQTYQTSSSPHVRSPLTTGIVMYDVILALLPATVFGVWHFGVHALLIVLMSIASAVLNTDYTLTLTFTDGTTYTTPSIRGAQGQTGATGQTGAAGVGISGITQNAPTTCEETDKNRSTDYNYREKCRHHCE